MGFYIRGVQGVQITRDGGLHDRYRNAHRYHIVLNLIMILWLFLQCVSEDLEWTHSQKDRHVAFTSKHTRSWTPQKEQS